MRSRSKFLNVFSLAGLLLGSGACDSRKQYNSPPPPAPIDKSSSSIIPSDKLPQLVDGSGNIAEDVTPEQVISLASAWSKETIVWNKSAGGVVVGETDPQKWEAEIDRLSSVASFSLTAAPNFRSLNLTSRNGQIVADTVAGINVFSSYKGELPITRPDGSVTSIVLERDSLIDAGIIPLGSSSEDFFLSLPTINSRLRCPKLMIASLPMFADSIRTMPKGSLSMPTIRRLETTGGS
jgi:hypothetical protein